MIGKYRLILVMLIAALSVTTVRGTDRDSAAVALTKLIRHAVSFTEKLPREKVSVHTDQNGYFKGEKIRFQCYVVDAAGNTPTTLSGTLHVELLNPRGLAVDRQILKIENGRCHGEFNLVHVPFYSGFYEIRAYTKYMLNFGDAAIFSRVIPVFDAPKTEGDYSIRKMVRNISKFPGTRPSTKPERKLTMRFFPEGGRLIDGVATRVAFEITGPHGNPADARGIIVDEITGQTIAELHTQYEGRGLFEITPFTDAKYKVMITSDEDGSGHTFRMPEVSAGGIGLRVDCMSDPDTIFVTVSSVPESGNPGLAGLALTSRGVLTSYSLLSLSGSRTLRFHRRELMSGVAVFTVFSPQGEVLAERMIFVDNGGYGRIITTQNVDERSGKVTLELLALDSDGCPASGVPLSVSVTDRVTDVASLNGLSADLLLTSEVDAYLRNPMQYFGNDPDRGRKLDLMMMTAGPKCCSWEAMAGVSEIEVRYPPEKCIELPGQVVSFTRGIPQPGAEISVMMSERDVPDSVRRVFTDRLTADSCGRFTLVYDLGGKWDMVMSVSENGRKKDHRVILDRLFQPAPRKYEAAELLVELAADDGTVTESPVADHTEISDTGETPDQEDIVTADIPEKTIGLDEVVVKGKRNRQADIYKARAGSIVRYDMQEELGDVTDRGQVVGQDLYDALMAISPAFQSDYVGNYRRLLYEGKPPLFVIDYKPTYGQDSLNYTYLTLESIKSVYISENPSTMAKYADPMLFTTFGIDLVYGCAVLIETFDELRAATAHGTRHQTVVGYTLSPVTDDMEWILLPEERDRRRTLYWNPALITDREGKIRLEYSGGAADIPARICVRGISDDGTIYSY